MRTPAVGAIALALALMVGPPGEARPLKPWSRIGADMAGDAIASAAIKSGNPWLMIGGATYKVADVAADIGDAAIDREDRWLDAEMVLADKDARRLKEIQTSGGDLNGKEAEKIKQALRDRQYQMTSKENSPYGYTCAVIVSRLPYAVARVAIDKTVEWGFGLALRKLGSVWLKFLQIDDANWATAYGGSLTDNSKIGWGKLTIRAVDAEKAAEAALKSEEEKEAAEFFANDRTDELKREAADALSNLRDKMMQSHPSQPVTTYAPAFRADFERAVMMAPAPLAEAMVARVAAAPAPVLRAVEAARDADPVAGEIAVDDAERNYSRPASSESDTYVSPASAPAQEEEKPAWEVQMHAESALVGDGKTFQVCSNGCQATPNASWDGRQDADLYGQ